MKILPFVAAFLSITSTARAQVRTYGPLVLNFDEATRIENTIVLPAKNQQGQALFLGIFCEERLFNFTGEGYRWKDWGSPTNVYEARIVSDVCNQI